MRKMDKVGRVSLALVLGVTITLAACSTAWIAEAEQIVAALIPAAANIVALVAALQGKSVSAADLPTIQNAGTQAGADLQLIQSLIAAYQKADATAKPGILNQIQTAMTRCRRTEGSAAGAAHPGCGDAGEDYGGGGDCAFGSAIAGGDCAGGERTDTHPSRKERGYWHPASHERARNQSPHPSQRTRQGWGTRTLL